MGTDSELGWADEKPAHRVRVDGFWMDETDVTNAQFRRFVEATDYVTTAEKPPDRRGDPERSCRPARRGRPRRTWFPARWSSRRRKGRCRLRDFSQWWTVDARRQLAASRRSRQQHRGQGRSSGRPRLLGRCRRLCEVGRQATADRGRVGVRRPRRPGQQALCLGRRSSRPTPHPRQHLAGRVPVQEHGRRRLRAHHARSRPSRPTAMACTTCPATSGSGAATGTRSTSTASGPARE